MKNAGEKAISSLLLHSIDPQDKDLVRKMGERIKLTEWKFTDEEFESEPVTVF